MRKPLRLFVAAFALTAASFFVAMLISPRTTVAEPTGAVDVYSIGLLVPQELPDIEQQYRRHTGVLDTLP